MCRPSPSRFLLLLLTALLSWGCGSDSPLGPVEEITELPRELSLSEILLVEAGNSFSFDLLKALQEEEPDSNLFVSPFSASMALGMTLNGTRGETYEEMREVLGFQGMTMDQINQGYRDLLDLLLNLDSTVDLGVGNSIWYREGFSVRSDFLDRTRTFFDAEVQELDFGSPQAPGIINDWVRDETKGKIKTIIDDGIDATTVMYLINATYFKGIWRTRFDKGDTRQAQFTGDAGTVGTVALMTLEDTLPYTETELYQAVDLPYGAGAFSMTVVLPREGHTLREVTASLDAESWQTLTESLHKRAGTVFLPRFRLEWEKVLNETLQGMGMVDAFLPGQADFSGLSDLALELGLFVSEVKQKSFVEVNEEGTEAAAVTSVAIELTALPDDFLFRADHPFLFVIRERLTNTILFAGGVMTPPEA